MADARLEVLADAGRQVRIDKAPFRLGRRVDSDLVLPQGEVSRDHAEIVAAGSSYAIKDRGSRGGTFINDEAATERVLADGDRIRLGRTGGRRACLSPCGRTAQCPGCRRGYGCGRRSAADGGAVGGAPRPECHARSR